MTGERTSQVPDWLRENALAAIVICIAYFTITERVPEDLRTASRILLFGSIVLAPRLPLLWGCWAALACALAIPLGIDRFDLPNHHYVLTYISVVMALSLSAAPEEAGEYVRANARWILVIVMGFATLQKAISPDFMDGSYLGFVLARGGFGGPVLALCETCSDLAARNVALVEGLRAAAPTAEASVALSAPLQNLALLARGFSWLILATEAWLCAAYLLLPDRQITALSLLAFAATLGLVRQEFLFISVVSLLGLLACDPRLVWLRRGLAVATVVFAAGAIA